MTCRCGHPKDSPDPHPCHAGGYSCRKPAKERIYALPGMAKYALAGAQMKLAAERTWACDECWAEHAKRLAEAAANGC